MRDLNRTEEFIEKRFESHIQTVNALLNDASKKNSDILTKISVDLAVNTNATKAIEKHLELLNGKVAKNIQDIAENNKQIITLKKDNESLFERFGEVSVFRTELEKEQKQNNEKYKSWLASGFKTMLIILAVLFFNLLVKTGIISNITGLPF